MEPIYIFTIAGSLAMAGALSTRELMQKIASDGGTVQDQVPQKTTQQAYQYLLAGNVSAVALILALIYGWQVFAWWIPISFSVISFPAIYYIFLKRIFTTKLSTVIYPVAAWLALIPVIQGWIA